MKLRDAGYMTSAYWLTKEAERGLTIYADNGTTPAFAQASKDYTYVKFAVESGEFGVRVAPTGVLEIQSSGDRDPDWRHRQRCRFGVGLDLASEFAGQLVCPHTQRVIPVSRIENNPVLWIDLQYKKAIVAGRLKYETPDGPPIQSMRTDYDKTRIKIKYSFANQKRHKDFAVRFETIFQEATLRKSLTTERPNAWPKTDLWFKLVLIDQPAVVDIETCLDVIDLLGLKFDPDPLIRLNQVVTALAFVDLNSKGSSWAEQVKGWCADHYESDYLIYKEA